MAVLALWSWLPVVLEPILLILSIVLILLVLIQRGKGGGLSGAFGGVGGSSAFGSRAGDLFTRITIGVAATWIFLCAVEVYVVQNTRGQQEQNQGVFETNE